MIMTSIYFGHFYLNYAMNKIFLDNEDVMEFHNILLYPLRIYMLH